MKIRIRHFIIWCLLYHVCIIVFCIISYCGYGYWQDELMILYSSLSAVGIMAIYYILRDASNYLRNKGLKKQYMWIPVSERLPDEKINPITENYYVYPVIYKNKNIEDIRYYGYGNGHWYHGLKIMDDYVVAWYQLPEQYKESDNHGKDRNC